MDYNKSTGIIVLAAGASTRMGQAKQLLRVQGESLLQRSVRTAMATSFRPIVVVLGAQRELVELELKGLEVKTTYNAAWSSGMGSSIASGMKHLLACAPDLERVLLLVGDQPYLSTEVLIQLTQTNEPLAVAQYANTLGVPAMFERSLFPELKALGAAPGAKALIQQYRDQAAVVDFPDGAFDIDTPADWAAFLTKSSAKPR
jgi:molybdenum cofactor cytidylyltransferase